MRRLKRSGRPNVVKNNKMSKEAISMTSNRIGTSMRVIDIISFIRLDNIL